MEKTKIRAFLLILNILLETVQAFFKSKEGAKASARLYSLIETARANKLNPQEYLEFLFEKLPAAETEDQLRSLLLSCIHPNMLEENKKMWLN